MLLCGYNIGDPRLKSKTVVLVGDLHVGATTGLTTLPKTPAQIQLLDRWRADIRAWSHPDILICNGDAIDGPDPKSHDTDGSKLEQQDLQACKLLEMWHAKDYIIVAGTPYHVGATEDHEDNVASLLRQAGNAAVFVDKLKAKINGWFGIQCRHFIGKSAVPHSRATAPSRAKIWEILNAYVESKRAANFMVFSHIHEFQYLEDAFGVVVTLPCYQAKGGRFGNTKCDGRVDLGACRLTVAAKESGGWQFEKRLFRVVSHRPTLSL